MNKIQNIMDTLITQQASACKKQDLIPIFLLLFLAGCNMNDPMIKEMETAYATVSQKKGGTHEKRVEAVTLVVQKYFPPGMKVEEALKLLQQLKEQGFSVGEYHHDKARRWPDGEFKPYVSPSSHDRKRRQEGMVEYIARKQYDSKYLIVTKHTVISITTDHERVLHSEGDIWASGI
jgi:hypothetical protein